MRLFHNDCFNVFPTLEDNSIDLTVTSPPYDNLRTYNNSLVWNEGIWKKLISELFRVTKDGGVVVWVVGDATIKGSETGTSFKQALYAMECGFKLHDTMIYSKQAMPYDPKCKRYWNSFEFMFVFVKGKIKTCNYIKEPCKTFGKVFNCRPPQLKPCGDVREDRRKDYKTKPEKIKQNVWYYGQELKNRARGHPAQFPLSLAEDHIKSWSNEEDVVFDPMMGSGTTGLACRNLNREFIGIEKELEYYEIAKERINNGK